jgi:hypothetical protein
MRYFNFVVALFAILYIPVKGITKIPEKLLKG